MRSLPAVTEITYEMKETRSQHVNAPTDPPIPSKGRFPRIWRIWLPYSPFRDLRERGAPQHQNPKSAPASTFELNRSSGHSVHHNDQQTENLRLETLPVSNNALHRADTSLDGFPRRRVMLELRLDACGVSVLSNASTRRTREGKGI